MLHRTPGIIAMLSTLVLSKIVTFSHHLRLATLSLHTPLPLRTLRWKMPAPVLETPVKVTNILFPIHQFARPLIFTYLITPDTGKEIVSTVQQEKPSPGLQFLCIKFRQLRKLPVKLLSRSNSTLSSVLGVRGREPCRPRTTWRRG